jgi:hypothetical protein
MLTSLPARSFERLSGLRLFVLDQPDKSGSPEPVAEIGKLPTLPPGLTYLHAEHAGITQLGGMSFVFVPLPLSPRAQQHVV